MANTKSTATARRISTLNLTPTDKQALIAELMLSEDDCLSRQVEDTAVELQCSPLMLRYLRNTVQSVRSGQSPEQSEIELALAIARLRVASQLHLHC